MRFTVSTSALAKQLEIIAGVVYSKNDLEVINSIVTKIENAIYNSGDEYFELQQREKRLAIDLKSGSKYDIIHDFIKAKICQEFINSPYVRIVHDYGLFGILIKDKIFIRFNKINQDFTISNNSGTERFRNCKQQKFKIKIKEGVRELSPDNPQLSIPFIKELEVPVLNAGYQVNKTWTGFDKILLVYRKEDCKGNLVDIWVHELQNTSKQTTIFSNNEKQENITKKSRIKIKDDKLKSTGTDDIIAT